MNFINQIINMLFYLLLFNQNILMTMQNDIEFNLDQEYTNLLLLSNFDSAKQPGIDEEQINLERRMQFRLIAWNIAEKYGLENEMKKLARNKKGEIVDMIKFACELWDKTIKEEQRQEGKIIQKNPERDRQLRKELRKQWEEEPFSMSELAQMTFADCARLEFHLNDKSDPFEEMPKWVNNFFLDANQMHLEALTKLLSGNELEEENFDFWWTKFQKRIQELHDEEQIKNALELEDAEAKMGRSKAIVPFIGSKKKEIPLKDVNEDDEGSQFLREMRKLAINSITKDGQEEMKLVKRQIIKMTSAKTLIELEQLYPTILGIGTIEEEKALELYKNISKATNEAEMTLWEFRMSGAFLYGRIWRELFDQLFGNVENEENIRIHLNQLFEISKKFSIFSNLTNFNKYDGEKICLELLQLWRKIMGGNEDHENADKMEKNFEVNRMAIRKELLWKEHWAWLDVLKKMDKPLLDSNYNPGNIYKFSEFFGGFEQIWSKINEMEKSGERPLQLDRVAATENPRENFIDRMLAPFRTKLTDLRMIYNIEDYFDKIVLISESFRFWARGMMWKTTGNIKRSILGLDMLIWMSILDEHFDQISTRNDGQQLVNAWWNARVEMEIFHDSLAIREGGYEGVEKPALYMLNWMYLLKHQKCITKNEAESITHNREFEEDEKEENRKEMNKNLKNYIEKCKKVAKKFTDKNRKYFDEHAIRKSRWDYLKQLIQEGERFYSLFIATILADKIENQEILTKIEELIGSEFLDELKEISRKTTCRRNLVEKWIEIFQILDKKSRFQTSLDSMYFYTKFLINDKKYYSKKLQNAQIYYQREDSRRIYDTTIRIEQQIANVLEIEEKDELENPTTNRTKNNEKTVNFTRQINMIRSIKMINDLSIMIDEAQKTGMPEIPEYNKIQMVSSEFVQANFDKIVEELRNYHMKNVDFKRFAGVLQSDPQLVDVIRNEVGSVYTLNTLLGYNDNVKEKRNIDIETAGWNDMAKGDNEIGEVVKKAKRNIEIVWEEATIKGAGSNLDNPLRDINFFNDKRLLENYALSLKKYKLKEGENSPTIMHSLAANILVFMQHFEQLVMRSGRLLPKLESIRSKYGEQIRLFARIEYDKLLTDFGQVKFHVQREFFARLLSEINSRSKKVIIPEILQNYRVEKIAIENENDKLFEDYDENIQKFHSNAFLRLLRQEKEDKKKEEENEKEENKGKNGGKKLSFAKIISDAHSDDGRRQILFNFLGNFERIANVFSGIGPRGMKIQSKDYAHFVKGKAVQKMESPNEQRLHIALPEPLAEAKNLSMLQLIGAEPQKPPTSFKLLQRKPQATEAPKEKVKWADMTSDSDNSDNEGKGERKNVEIQIVESGNENQQIEEIGGNKKETEKKNKKEKIQMKEEATSSNIQKPKEKKKVRFQITTDEEALSNSPSTNQNDVPPVVDLVSSGSSGPETSSKSKKKKEKKKKKKAEKEYGKVKILKRDEKEDEIDEMVTLPCNEIAKQKMHDTHKLPAFENYFNDQFLYNKILDIYEKFIAEQKWSTEDHFFLTIGTYLNEIGHKFKALDGTKQIKILLPNSIEWELVEELRRELAKLKLNEEKEWKFEELNILMTKLHGIFTKLLAQIEDYSSGGGKEKDDENLYDQNYLRLQLNWICFARAICEEQKLEKIWSVKSITRQIYNRDFIVLIGQQPIIVVEQGQNKNEYKLNALEKLRTQFEKEYLIPYKQMLEQNVIDQQLLNENWQTNSASRNAIPIGFNKLAQQFRWSSEQIRQTRSRTQQIRDTVYNVVVNDDEDEVEGPGNRRRHQHIDFAIKRIEHIITTIWAPQSTLKIGGSYQLGTWTPSSDINAILIASKRVGRARFFGKSTCESNRWCLDIDSLFCQLCQNKNIFHLIRHPNNHIPHIKFTYCTHFERHQMDFDRSKLPAYQCAPFELVLISLPGYGIISEKTLQNTRLLIEQFRENGEEDIYEIDWNDSRTGMIHALSGYQLNEFILAKLANKNMLRVFRICLVSLKKWAENNHIYGGQYGFLNGASLGLMLLKILLRFPITPMVPFILEQFFVHFVNWPWPMPIQFAPLGADKTEASEKKLGWQADREKGQKQKMLQSKVRHVEGWHLLPTLTMPIISPCKPERNVAYSVNHSTQQIIQRQLKFGLEMIEKIREQQQNRHVIIEHADVTDNKYSWKSLLNDKKSFGEKYTHYIVFYCFAKTSSESAEQQDLGEQFCGEYVLYQLRLQLIFSVERNSSTGILRCHILPNKEKQQKKNLNELSRKLIAVPPEFRWNSLNRYWVIGLEFAGKDGNYDYAATEQLENWLNKSQYGFVEKFIQDYFIFSMRKHSKAEIYKKLANIHLYAKFVPAEELGQWTIGSQIWRPKEEKNLN